MDFLFRSPLIQFDISKSDEVIKNWNLIIEAISLSSNALYNAIKDKTPDQLTQKEKSSVYRYLLRGKYRATPFGRWAGVGVGFWGGEKYSNQQVVSETSEISSKSDSKKQDQNYWQNPSLEPWGGGWKFWNFDQEKEVWRFSKSGASPLVQRLREIALEDKPIDADSLFRPFPEMGFQEKREAWNYLLESQLIVPDRFSDLPQTEPKEDRFILPRISLPETYRSRISLFLDEIGETLIDQDRPYLVRLKDRFASTFDDRFVPLRLLWKLIPYLTFQEETIDHQNFEISLFPSLLDSKAEYLDLKNLIPKNKRENRLIHGQALFRVLANEKILIDNLTFNRPYVYGGRFTFQPEVFDYFSQQNDTDSGIILADVILYERQKLQTILRHKNLVEYQINCFSGSSSADELDCSQIFIGLVGNRFELYAPHLGKKIKPVFQHPLNPHFITHPVCRVLWEIAHQDTLRPIYYAHSSFTSAENLPELRWGDLIIQPKKWKLRKGIKCKTDDDLSTLIESKGLPNLVLVGNHDHEFALDLSDLMDRKVFLEELAKGNELNVFEWLWKSDEKGKKSPIFYPQFLWGKPMSVSEEEESRNPELINLVNGNENKSWVSIKVILRPDYQQHLVINKIADIFYEFAKNGIQPFYFLFYKEKSPEIRLRVKIKSSTEKVKISSHVLNYFNAYPDFEQVNLHPYYPEISKYSNVAIEISETLFFQESKLILKKNPLDLEEKISLAVGIGNLLIGDSNQLEYWIHQLNERSKGMTYHSSPDPYLEKFDRTVSKRWITFYSSQLVQHPWFQDLEMQGRLLGNHLHMAINRLFWEEAAAYEPKVFSILSAILRRKKFSSFCKKDGRQLTE